MKTATQEQATAAPPTTPRPLHFIPRGRDGRPADRALCGYLWDRLVGPTAPATIPRCEECATILRGLGGRMP